MDLLPKSYKKLIFLTSVLTSLVVALAFNITLYGLPTKANFVSAKGRLSITKNTVGGYGSFYITVTGPQFPAGYNFSIATTSTSNPSTNELVGDGSGIMPGTYTITEANQQGWSLASNGCASINVIAGQTASCTITNAIANNITPPTITSISPSTTLVDTAVDPFIVRGTNFTQNLVVQFGTASYDNQGNFLGISYKDEPTTYNSATQVSAKIPAADLDSTGTFDIRVRNGQVNSSAIKLTVVDFPAPTVQYIYPMITILDDNSSRDLKVNGTNFRSDSSVYFNDLQLQTQYVSSTQLKAKIPASSDQSIQLHLGNSGTDPKGYHYTSNNITVQSAHGTVSNTSVLKIIDPPSIVSLNPSSTGVSDSSIILGVNGANFFGRSSAPEYNLVSRISVVDIQNSYGLLVNMNAPTGTYVSTSSLGASVVPDREGVYQVKVCNENSELNVRTCSDMAQFTVNP